MMTAIPSLTEVADIWYHDNDTPSDIDFDSQVNEVYNIWNHKNNVSDIHICTGSHTYGTTVHFFVEGQYPFWSCINGADVQIMAGINRSIQRISKIFLSCL